MDVDKEQVDALVRACTNEVIQIGEFHFLKSELEQMLKGRQELAFIYGDRLPLSVRTFLHQLAGETFKMLQQKPGQVLVLHNRRGRKRKIIVSADTQQTASSQ